jgi:hypothetical protein
MGSPRLLAGWVAVQGRSDMAYPDNPFFETWYRAAMLAADETLRKHDISARA